MSLQLVGPVELLIAARVASVTINAGEQHASTEDQCTNRSWTTDLQPACLPVPHGSLGVFSVGAPLFQPFWRGARNKQVATGTRGFCKTHGLCLTTNAPKNSRFKTPRWLEHGELNQPGASQQAHSCAMDLETHLTNLAFSGSCISSCVAKWFLRHGNLGEPIVQATLCFVVK